MVSPSLTGRPDEAKPLRGPGRVCDVVSHERIRPAIDRGLEHHLVIRVPGLRPPLKMNFDRLHNVPATWVTLLGPTDLQAAPALAYPDRSIPNRNP
jgi:hypothetical protein